jgi:alginate O-acetyltransferase complex protein AlgI
MPARLTWRNLLGYMLFNSYQFVFFYLPIVFGVFFWIGRSSHRFAAAWLAGASLFFYGWWNPQFVALLVASVGFNYATGFAIGRAQGADSTSGRAKWILTIGLVFNLGLLGYFKYANFFIRSANQLSGSGWELADIVLPLGISFFTFTQIAFLVDVYRRIAREYDFVHYLLFVTYFPHLIAGPVLHHKQMMPQFELRGTYKFDAENVSIGLTIFTVGLFKKVLLADQFALYANPIFDAAEGTQLQLVEAWIGAVAYALQLYFDFSGYSDMAIGLSRMFNVKLPQNFNSPYKADSIIEFWRRWHMTLSAFLRDYLYIPLGGNRCSATRRYINVLVTMLLGGLWHGANWTFVFWGGLHGVYLVFNQGWRSLSREFRLPRIPCAKLFSTILTFIAVVVAWVPFRANSLDTALAMLSAMSGLHGVSLTGVFERRFPWLAGYGFVFDGVAPVTGLPVLETGYWLTMGLAVVWILPNAQRWLSDGKLTGGCGVANPRWSDWRPSRSIGLFTGAVLGISLLGITRASEFLYFQF